MSFGDFLRSYWTLTNNNRQQQQQQEEVQQQQQEEVQQQHQQHQQQQQGANGEDRHRDMRRRVSCLELPVCVPSLTIHHEVLYYLPLLAPCSALLTVLLHVHE
jgi:hypothetical protein